MSVETISKPLNCGHAQLAAEPHAVCSECKRSACDECSDNWPAACACCGGPICTDCADKVRSRRVDEVSGYGAPYTESLCGPCATKQDAARARIIGTIESSATQGSLYQSGNLRYPEHIWLSDIISELEDALMETRKAL